MLKRCIIYPTVFIVVWLSGVTAHYIMGSPRLVEGRLPAPGGLSELLDKSTQELTVLTDTYLALLDPELTFVSSALNEQIVTEFIVHGRVIESVCMQVADMCEDSHYGLINLTTWLILAKGPDEITEVMYAAKRLQKEQ